MKRKRFTKSIAFCYRRIQSPKLKKIQKAQRAPERTKLRTRWPIGWPDLFASTFLLGTPVQCLVLQLLKIQKTMKYFYYPAAGISKKTLYFLNFLFYIFKFLAKFCSLTQNLSVDKKNPTCFAFIFDVSSVYGNKREAVTF